MLNSEANSKILYLRAIARGRVQGVNYRAFVFEKAKQLNLTGFVRNLPSIDEVEIQAIGEKQNLERLIIFLNKGPHFARVDEVSVSWAKPDRFFQSFEIKY